MSERSFKPEGPPLYCSFCGKTQYEVEVMVAAALVQICNECVDVCNGTIAEMREAKAAQEAKEQPHD